MSASPALIAIDWGTTAFRAYLLSNNGRLLDRVMREAGILTVENADFESVLSAACDSWIKQYDGLPILMCGMIGSRQGWHEVPYIDGDVGAVELAAASVVARDGANPITIIPGVKAHSFAGGPDVMRGEETILIGAIAAGKSKTATYCLPGTHTKWVSVLDGRIREFSSYMTGELFAILSDRSILGAMIADESSGSEAHRQHSFQRGLEIAADASNLLHNLFSIRARTLTESTDTGITSEVLSGLLIGTELRSMSPYLQQRTGKIVLLSSGALSGRYQRALDSLGYAVEVYDAGAACVDGLASIARELGLIDRTDSESGRLLRQRSS